MRGYINKEDHVDNAQENEMQEGKAIMAKVVSLGIHIADILGRPVIRIPEGQNLAIIDEIRITVAGTAAGTSIDLAKRSADRVSCCAGIRRRILTAHRRIGLSHQGGNESETLNKKGADDRLIDDNPPESLLA